MDITFIYNGKTYTTPNLDKKMKRMKITKDDIQIIDNIEKPKKIIKDLRHLDKCIEANYENGFQCYYYPNEQVSDTIGNYKLINVKQFEEWSVDYLE